jgi:hypothetical protein
MSQQRDIFNKLQAVQSTQNIATYESPASRAMDNMDITDFLFTLIKQTAGQEGLNNIVVGSALGELNGNMNINTTILNIITQTFFCLFDIIIPTDLTVGHTGFYFKVSEIDPTNMLSTNPSSPQGKYLYDSNDPSTSLNCLIYSAMTSSQNSPVQYTKNGKTLFTLTYYNGNQMQFYFGAEYANQKLSAWAEDYMQGVTFFNMPNFLAELVDILTGIVSIKTNSSAESVQQNATLQTVLSKLFGFCQASNGNNSNESNLNTGQQVTVPINVSPMSYLQNQEDKKNNGNNPDTGNLFDFTPDEMLSIQDTADLLTSGTIRFSTCGNFEVTIDPDSTLSKMDALFADSVKDSFTQYTDPTTNQTTTVPIYDNNAVIPDISNTAAFLNNVLSDNALATTNANAGNTQGSPSANDISYNLPNMQAEFQLSIIKAIPFALTTLIISPQLVLLLKASEVVIGESNNTSAFTLESVINQLSGIISKIGADIWNSIMNNMFSILVKELVGILKNVASAYLSQQAQNYLSIIEFLVSLLKPLSLQPSSCTSMLDIITQLLSLNYFGPSPPVPAPLIYATGILKPGMNEVSAVNNLKSSLASKGVEVGATLSDGSPNYGMMIAEETLRATMGAVRNAKVEVMTTGTGVSTGYGQIS